MQWVHGCFPSHLIFFLLHSSQALVTLRLFCMGTAGRGAVFSGPVSVGECGAESWNSVSLSGLAEVVNGAAGSWAAVLSSLGIVSVSIEADKDLRWWW